MPLGDHLRADQDVDLPRREPLQHRRDGAAPADRVAIDARDPGLREQRRDLRFDPLGAEADVLEIVRRRSARRPTGSRTA